MKLHLEIPDDIAERLSAGRSDLSRRALEALALEAFKAGQLSKSELRRLLGFATRGALDGFLKDQDVFEEYSAEDREHEGEG